MKKWFCVALAAMMVLSLVSVASAEDDYVIRIYSNSNSTERQEWLINAAAEAGFKVSLDDNSVYSGDTAAVQAANENKDADIVFGLNEVRWSQLMNGQYPNLKVMDWKPSWADAVGEYKFDNKAYGLVIQNILMLYRTDEFGTNGKELHFQHWADLVDAGYTWYRQGKVGGTTNMNINNAMLYSFTDPTSPAGGICCIACSSIIEICCTRRSKGNPFLYNSNELLRWMVGVGTPASATTRKPYSF